MGLRQPDPCDGRGVRLGWRRRVTEDDIDAPCRFGHLKRPGSPTFNPIIRFGIARLQGDVDNTTDF
jgi:hypothetical protein